VEGVAGAENAGAGAGAGVGAVVGDNVMPGDNGPPIQPMAAEGIAVPPPAQLPPQQPLLRAEAVEAPQQPGPHSPTRLYSRRDNPLYRDNRSSINSTGASATATAPATGANKDGKVYAWENPDADSDDETEQEENQTLVGIPSRPFTRSQLRQREEHSPQPQPHDQSGDAEGRHGAAYRRKAYEDFDDGEFAMFAGTLFVDCQYLF